MSTTIQILVLLSNSTFDQPATPDGRQWKTALCHLGACPSFFTGTWGRHLEAREKVTLLVDWNSTPAAQTFLTTHYAQFADLLAPLLAVPPELPYAADINTILAEPAAYPGGGVSTIHKLTYNALNANERSHLLSSKFDIYIQCLGWAARTGEEGAAGFKGGSVAWAVDGAGTRTTTLFMLISWDSVEAEQECERTLRAGAESKETNLKKAILERALEQADPGGEVWHVAWDMFDKEMATGGWWKDSENPTWPYSPLKDSKTVNTM